MDSLTHLVAGALTPVCFPRAPRRAAVIGFGIAAGEFPDIDIFCGGSPEVLMTVHRGITHALLWQPLMALALVLPFYLLLQRRLKTPRFTYPARSETAGSSPVPESPPCIPKKNGLLSRLGNSFGLGTMFVAALVALYTHIYLDCMTTFGTQIFLPFAQTRVGLPSMFIVDLQLTLPALALLIAAWLQKPVSYDEAISIRCGLRPHPAGGNAQSLCPQAPLNPSIQGTQPGAVHLDAPGNVPGPLLFSPRARLLARIGLAWMLLYPLCSLGINALAADSLAPKYADGNPSRVTLLTEAFSPYVWKLVVDDGDTYRVGTAFLTSAGDNVDFVLFAKGDRALVHRLGEQRPIFRYFSDFSPTLAQAERPAPAEVQARYRGGVREYAFMDLRYVISRDSPARLFGRKDGNFILEARVDRNERLVAYRFLQRGKLTTTPWTEVE